MPALESWLTPELVIGELADEVDELAYAADPTGANLESVRESYHAVPEHRRIHLLGDMDQNDVPVRILLAEVGETIPARSRGRTLTVTLQLREQALDYFRRSAAGGDRDRARRVADGPETTVPLVVGGTVHPGGWPDPAGLEVLQIDYPAAGPADGPAGRDGRAAAGEVRAPPGDGGDLAGHG
ncbi:DUF7639 domain-containing protein [Amycolatopsis rifamycinica]|uniref:DUF7639 domain-containing protein n=1 Tax=Amycolatopsis rifamycinica TaxID=287986 RepID=A0A066U509_9PSEU|nr:hypothetical protein [Amycolatopsis rifamycinica]KDN22551.1 hypothetical protein DV20_09010 [Amycolatopsis rifamycinica]